MIVLNFAHPLTATQLEQVNVLTGHTVDRVIDVSTHVNALQTLAPQVAILVEQCGLSSQEWQTLPLLINPPGLSSIAVVLLAELHGRCGYFPAHLRLRRVEDSIPAGFEAAEVLDLQSIRETARQQRG